MNKDRGKNDPMQHLERLRDRAGLLERSLRKQTRVTKDSQQKQIVPVPVTGAVVQQVKYLHNKGIFKV